MQKLHIVYLIIPRNIFVNYFDENKYIFLSKVIIYVFIYYTNIDINNNYF